MKRYFYLLLLLFTYLSGYAQRDSIPLNTIIEKTAVVNNDHPIEKVYLHFDKPYYAVGDTIWFKGYLTLDIHQPSNISKVLNIDVISSRDSVVESLKLPVTNSAAAGRIVLNGINYHQGNYRIRAYTNWMLNFKQSYMFEKNLAIGSALNKDVTTQIQYSGSLYDKNPKLGARVLYRTKDGTVLSNRHVDWRVETNGDVVSKGRANTDAQGYANIEIGDAKTQNFSGTSLITSIDIADKKTANNSFSLKNAFNGADLQFFPEGGNLVAGVISEVGFKAIQSNGLGVDVKGTIVDGLGKEITQFSSKHLGMGKFQFMPEGNTTYKALAEFPDGTKATYLLPRVVSNGITLAVNNENPSMVILQVSASPDFFRKNQNRVFYILARMGGFVAYAAQTPLTSQSYSATIPKSKFKTGVVELSLLSSSGDPLSERLFFVNHDDNLNIGLSSDKPSYGVRQKVSMKVNAKQQDHPVEGNFSVAVIDETKTPFSEDAATTILSHLLLTSDVTGYIEKPNYYFNHPDVTKVQDLDLLMMTQGFRQFDLYDVVSGKIPRVGIPPEQGITLTGNLRKLNGIPVFKGAVRLIIPDKNFSQEALTDADGNFAFQNVVFTDSSAVTITARNNPDARNLKITVNGEFYPSITKTEIGPDQVLNIDSALNKYIQNSEKQYEFNKVLKEVVIRSTVPVKKIDHTKYSALTGLSAMADHEISGDRFQGCNNFFTCFQAMAQGLTYDNNNFYITRDYTQGKKIPVQIYVKGMPVDVTYLNNINAAEVESVEIFNSDGLSSINRMNNTNGVVSINMKEMPKGERVKISDLKDLFPEQNVITFNPKGYAKVKQFYSPKYLVPRSMQISDLRTTIYWNPSVTTDKTGTAVFDFYNADGRGTYKAVIEGIDKDGNIGRTVYRYTVK